MKIQIEEKDWKVYNKMDIEYLEDVPGINAAELEKLIDEQFPTTVTRKGEAVGYFHATGYLPYIVENTVLGLNKKQVFRTKNPQLLMLICEYSKEIDRLRKQTKTK